MSGGSMNYLYSKLEYDATFRTDTPERKAFAKHLQRVAKALHDIEWVDSSDYGPGDENDAIRACLGDALVLEAAIEQAHEAAKVLRAELERACSGRPNDNVTGLAPEGDKSKMKAANAADKPTGAACRDRSA